MKWIFCHYYLFKVHFFVLYSQCPLSSHQGNRYFRFTSCSTFQGLRPRAKSRIAIARGYDYINSCCKGTGLLRHGLLHPPSTFNSRPVSPNPSRHAIETINSTGGMVSTETKPFDNRPACALIPNTFLSPRSQYWMLQSEKE
jgi:hypothetical protein